MKNSVQIVRPGILTTIQNLDCAGQGNLDMNTSGTFDRESTATASRMVVSGESLAVFEYVVGGLKFQVAERAVISFAGAHGEVTVEQDGKVIKTSTNSRIMVGAKAIVWLGTFDAGLRGYIAIRKGVGVTEVLGSRSYNTLGKLGPTPLQAGQVLQVGDPEYSTGSSIAVYPAPHQSSETARPDVVPGPRADWFTSESIGDFLRKTWTATQEANRVELRLGRTTLERQITHELASEGIVPGAIRVLASGQPIIFDPDHPATGGYPVVGILAESSLSRTGQLVPSAKVQFHRVWAAWVCGVILHGGAPLHLPAISVTQLLAVKPATVIERASFSNLSVADAYAISTLRTDVFYLEQSCTEPEMDWRDLEDTAEYYFIRDTNDSRKIIAYLRVIDTLDKFPSGYPRTIGRVVVGATARDTGLSSQLLRQVIIDYPNTGLVLRTQTRTKGVYVKAGFHEVGKTFMEAGIERITTVRDAVWVMTAEAPLVRSTKR